MPSYVSVKDRSGEYKRKEVQKEVYDYILQLESAIIDSNFNGIKRLYPERFGKADWDE